MYTYIYINPSKQLVVNVPVWLVKNKINLQINDSVTIWSTSFV